MLPWESMGILKCEYINRILSVSSILYAYAKCSTMPIIDPLGAYYRITLNENSYACKLEEWLKLTHNLKGKKCGDPDNTKELFTVLESPSLFIYYGHRSDSYDIYFGDHLKNLHKCSTAILMGCSSRILNLKPGGPPLNYLLAGSPVVIANLWNVSASEACYYCTLLFHALESSRECKSCMSTCGCEHNRYIGSLIGEVRNKLSSKNFIGAAAVCYGVPTKIGKKNLSC